MNIGASSALTFNDPMTSYWRLDKTITRFQKLISYYPLDKPKNDKLVE